MLVPVTVLAPVPDMLYARWQINQVLSWNVFLLENCLFSGQVGVSWVISKISVSEIETQNVDGPLEFWKRLSDTTVLFLKFLMTQIRIDHVTNL